MKTKLLTLALLIMASLSSFAQNKEDLKTRTQQVIDVYNDGNYKTLMGYMYPKIFTVASKEEILASMDEKRKGKDYKISMVKTDPSIDYGSILRTDYSMYCIITYTVQMKVGLEEKVPAKDKKEVIKRFKGILNTDDIIYDKSGVIHAKKRIQAVAIADEATHGAWSFVFLDGSPYVDQVLQEDIKKAIASQ